MPITYETLYDIPGHLVRRCHQIAVGMFHEALEPCGLTPIQFAILWGCRNFPGMDQAQLGRIVGVDRTTIGNVILRLEGKEFLSRSPDPNDRRIKRLSLTPAGEAELDAALPLVQSVQDRLLAPLSEEERQDFVRLMALVVDAHNECSRVPMASPCVHTENKGEG